MQITNKLENVSEHSLATLSQQILIFSFLQDDEDFQK